MWLRAWKATAFVRGKLNCRQLFSSTINCDVLAALKIHLSWSTAALLQSLPHYHVSPRGETFIKVSFRNEC